MRLEDIAMAFTDYTPIALGVVDIALLLWLSRDGVADYAMEKGVFGYYALAMVLGCIYFVWLMTSGCRMMCGG